MRSRLSYARNHLPRTSVTFTVFNFSNAQNLHGRIWSTTPWSPFTFFCTCLKQFHTQNWNALPIKISIINLIIIWTIVRHVYLIVWKENILSMWQFTFSMKQFACHFPYFATSKFNSQISNYSFYASKYTKNIEKVNLNTFFLLDDRHTHTLIYFV